MWSPDGSYIIYRAFGGAGAYDLYQKPVSGEKKEEVLLKSDQDKTPTSLSHDGRFLLYTAEDPKTKGDLWVLPLEGDHTPTLFTGTEFNEQSGQFSPNMRWIAYVSNETGSNEIYVRPFSPGSTGPTSEAGGKWMVSKGGGNSPRWRADSKELFYRDPDGTVISVEVMSGPAFRSATPRTLFQTPYAPFGYDVSGDGKRFLFATRAELGTPSPFTIVLNWQAGLKK